MKFVQSGIATALVLASCGNDTAPSNAQETRVANGSPVAESNAAPNPQVSPNQNRQTRTRLQAVAPAGQPSEWPESGAPNDGELNAQLLDSLQVGDLVISHGWMDAVPPIEVESSEPEAADEDGDHSPCDPEALIPPARIAAAFDDPSSRLAPNQPEFRIQPPDWIQGPERRHWGHVAILFKYFEGLDDSRMSACEEELPHGIEPDGTWYVAHATTRGGVGVHTLADFLYALRDLWQVGFGFYRLSDRFTQPNHGENVVNYALRHVGERQSFVLYRGDGPRDRITDEPLAYACTTLVWHAFHKGLSISLDTRLENSGWPVLPRELRQSPFLTFVGGPELYGDPDV